MQQITFRAMGCEMLAVLDREDATGATALADVPRWFDTWEQQLSRFRADSELCALNEAGYLRSASPALWHVVQFALSQARVTDGLVTPTLLHALENAGYDRSFDAMQPDALTGISAEPQREADQTIPLPSAARSAWQAIRCDAATRAIQLPAGVRLDLGGSAKGWAADEAARRLARSGSALVDAGGDVAVSGPRADGTPWPIGVVDPGAPDQQIELLLLHHGGVATSGRDYRRWRRHGRWQHHLIDPRTMQPAVTDILSATVIGPSAAEADIAAKAVLLQGSRAGLAWLEARPSMAGLVVREDGLVLHSSRLDAYRWHRAKEYEYE